MVAIDRIADFGFDRLQTTGGRSLMEDVRVCVRAGSVLTAMLAASVLSGPAFGVEAAPDISGTYWATQYNAKIQIVGGGALPLTPAGKAAYDKNIAGLKAGTLTDEA